MNNVKVKEIIKFSLYKNIQNKWFIIFNLLTLLSTIVMLNWGSISNLFTSPDKDKVFKLAIIDDINLAYEDLTIAFEKNSDFEIERITENTYTKENIPDDFAVIEIIPDDTEGFTTSITSKEGISTLIYNPIKDALYDSRNNILSHKYGVSKNELEIFQSDLTVDRIMLGVDADNSETKEIIKLISTALTYFVTILIFSKMANEIAQEKQSKSSEYLLTTVSAKEYLFAKIFSNIAILLIQGIFIIVYYFIAIGFMNIINIATTDITISSGILTNTIDLDTIFYVLAVLIYNILNLILLCIVQATLSAKTASTSEAGNTVSILIFLTMIAYFITLYVITPYTKVTGWLYAVSCLPLLSSYLVPAMMVIGQASIWQIIISLAVLIISIPLTFNFCANIFKNGILDYTKVKKIKEKEIDKETERKIFLMKRKMKNIGFVTGLAILIYIGLQMILSLIGNFVLPSLLKSVLTDTDITLILQALLQIISLGLASEFVFAYCNRNSKNKPKNDGSLCNKITRYSKFKIVLVCLLIITVLQVLLSGFIYPKLGLDYDVTNMFDVGVNSSILTKVILVISLAVVPGIFEELFFRKALMDFTLPYGKYFALLFSSLLFGLIHMNLSQGLFAFLIGLIFGAVYLYTKDIKLTMLIHFINNGFAAISMILPESILLLITLILFTFLFAGLIYLIKAFVKKESREKIMKLFKINVSLDSVKNKYVYILSDYTFDISMILVFVMSVLTENMLR